MINPLHYFQKAWTRTHSLWGKAALLLFYSFVWAEIIWGIQILVDPLIVFPCFDAHATDTETLLAGSLLRQLNVMAIGVLMYADRGGIHLWNVGAVLSIFAVNTVLFFAMMIPYAQLDSFVTCRAEHERLINIKFGFLVWIIAAFICSTDERSAVIVDHATSPSPHHDDKHDDDEQDEPRDENNNNEQASITTSSTTTAGNSPPPFNPIYYLKQAWSNTHSIWGKAAIILFYSWLWFNILATLWAVFVPLQGMSCLQQHFTRGNVLMAKTYMRELYVYTLGFFLYADRGGIRVWNILMVVIFYTIWTALHLFDFVAPLQEFAHLQESCQDDFDNMVRGSWIMVGWLFLALLACLVDATRVVTTTVNNNETTDETTPLNP